MSAYLRTKHPYSSRFTGSSISFIFDSYFWAYMPGITVLLLKFSGSSDSIFGHWHQTSNGQSHTGYLKITILLCFISVDRFSLQRIFNFHSNSIISKFLLFIYIKIFWLFDNIARFGLKFLRAKLYWFNFSVLKFQSKDQVLLTFNTVCVQKEY